MSIGFGRYVYYQVFGAADDDQNFLYNLPVPILGNLALSSSIINKLFKCINIIVTNVWDP